MDNEIPIRDTGEKDSRAAEGTADAGVRIKGNNDSGGECGKRTRAYADIMPDTYSAGEDSTIFEREAIAADTGRISGIEEEVLGTAFVGEGIFLRGSGGGDAGDGTGIYRTPV
jgi:hypothetical protein